MSDRDCRSNGPFSEAIDLLGQHAAPEGSGGTSTEFRRKHESEVERSENRAAGHFVVSAARWDALPDAVGDPGTGVTT